MCQNQRVLVWSLYRDRVICGDAHLPSSRLPSPLCACRAVWTQHEDIVEHLNTKGVEIKSFDAEMAEPEGISVLVRQGVGRTRRHERLHLGRGCAAQRVLIDVGRGDRRCRIFLVNTHLYWAHRETRSKQMRSILEWMSPYECRAAVCWSAVLKGCADDEWAAGCDLAPASSRNLVKVCRWLSVAVVELNPAVWFFVYLNLQGGGRSRRRHPGWGSQHVSAATSQGHPASPQRRLHRCAYLVFLVSFSVCSVAFFIACSPPPLSLLLPCF